MWPPRCHKIRAQTNEWQIAIASVQYFVAAATHLWRPNAIIVCTYIECSQHRQQGARGTGARGKCKFDFTFRIVASLCNCHNVIPFRILICVLIRFSHRFRFRFRFRFCAWVCFGFAAVLVFWFAALWFRFRVSHFPFRISIVTHTANFNFPLCLIDLRINYTKY